MTIKHNDIIIPHNGVSSPFKNCKLGREKYANVLTELINNYKDGFVMSINNSWGTGKTTFVKMWKQKLKNEGYKTLYFNAWENDFEKDPLVALISELKELEDAKSKTNFKKIIKHAAPLTKKLVPSIIKTLAKKHIGDDFVKELITGIAEVESEALEEQLKDYATKKRGLDNFKDSLKGFVKEVDSNNPIVFFIDELDRCRPNYAVEVLEQIKHLFSIPGIIFVLSIDKEQLGNAIRGVYGSDKIDAAEYLRRFIDLEYQIPKPNLLMYIDYLYNLYNFNEFIQLEERTNIQWFSNDQSQLINLAHYFYSNGDFTLRQIEKAFIKVRITLKSFHAEQYIYPEIVIFINYLDMKYSNILKKIREYQYTLQELVIKLEEILFSFKNIVNDRYNENLIASFLNKYNNGYTKNKNLNGDQLFSDDFNLLIDSKMDKDKLSSAIQNFRSDFNTSEIKLEFIIERYDLTKNIVN